MAEMIPESIPSGRPLGEGLVFDLLNKLPDEWFVYYEPDISGSHPDFVLICPDLGVLVIEVKDWSLDRIREANDDWIKIADGKNVVSRTNPVKQARAYMFGVMDTCRKHPEFKELCHAEGRYEGRYLFPFGHVVFLSKVRSSELHGSELNRVLREGRVVTRDILDSWKGLTREQAIDEIKKCFIKRWNILPLTPRQVDILRAAIHPEIVVGPALPEKGKPGEPVDLASIKILDWQQEIYARKIGAGHRVLNGVAGSGKTILLVHRARWLSTQDKEKKILVLCYNRALSAFLKSELQDCKNVTATTFHQWGFALKAKDDKDLLAFGKKVLDCVEGLQECDKYNAILIDEAQDFPSTWFECAVKALKDGEDGDLIIVADGNQGLYRPKEFKWKDVHVKAQGRVIPLRKNYRNTEQIMNLAWPFAEQTEDDIGEAIVSIKPVQAIRQGPEPYLFQAHDRQQEIDQIVELVSELLRGRWRSKELGNRLEPAEIGVIYPRVPDKSMWANFFALKARLEKLCDVIWLNERFVVAKDKAKAAKAKGKVAKSKGKLAKDKVNAAKDKVKEPGLKIQTIDTSKGLQYRACILMWADLLPSKKPPIPEQQERRRLYVGLTRAQDYLAITYTDQSKFTEQLETTSALLSKPW